MVELTATPPAELRDKIIADARSLPDLYAKASVMDPDLANALTGQAQAASVTPLGAFIAAGVAWLSAHYGLGWDDKIDALIAGSAILGGGYVTHWWQARKAAAPLYVPPGPSSPTTLPSKPTLP